MNKKAPWVLLLFFLGVQSVVLIPSVGLSKKRASNLELHVEEQISVYARPKEGRPAASLNGGERVPISRREYGDGYRRVVLRVDGKLRAGYILLADIKHSRIVKLPNFDKDKKWQKNEINRRKREKNVFGISAQYSNYSQGASEIEADAGQTFQLGELSGKSIFLSLFVDHPSASNGVFRLFASYKKFSFGGVAALGTTLTNAEPFVKDQTFAGGGFLYKYYPTQKFNLWLGPGLEMAKALNSTVTFEGSEPEKSDNLPLRFIASMALGFEFSLGSYYFGADVRYGKMVNSTPKVTLIESAISLGRYF